MTIVVQKRDQIDVYVNVGGTITIMQACEGMEDQMVAIHLDDIEAVCRALRAAKKNAREAGL